MEAAPPDKTRRYHLVIGNPVVFQHIAGVPELGNDVVGVVGIRFQICCNGLIAGRTLAKACLVSFRSWLVCIRSQKPSLNPKKRQRRRSVSAVIARRPLTIALMRLSGTSMACANRYWLIAIGRRNSSISTSPGGTSIKSVVVNDLNLPWPGFRLHVERLPEGCYLATSDEVPGLVAQGRSLVETLEIARDVAKGLMKAQVERG